MGEVIVSVAAGLGPVLCGIVLYLVTCKDEKNCQLQDVLQDVEIKQ